METNTVLLSLEDYNSLKEFQTEAIRSNSFTIHHSYNKEPTVLYTMKSVDAQLLEANDRLRLQMDALKELMNKPPDTIKELLRVDEISFYQFIKLKYFTK